MTDPYDRFRTLLGQNGYGLTAPRKAVFESLERAAEPCTIHEVILACRQKADRASVYRTIKLFEKLGVVQRLQIGWKYKLELSDGFTAHHHHLTCLGCGTVIDIEDERHVDKFIHEVSAKFRFTPHRHQFEIDGYCERCTDKNKEEN